MGASSAPGESRWAQRHLTNAIGAPARSGGEPRTPEPRALCRSKQAPKPPAQRNAPAGPAYGVAEGPPRLSRDLGCALLLSRVQVGGCKALRKFICGREVQQPRSAKKRFFTVTQRTRKQIKGRFCPCHPSSWQLSCSLFSRSCQPLCTPGTENCTGPFTRIPGRTQTKPR